MDYQHERLVGQGFSYVSQLEKGNATIRQECIARYKEHLLTARQLTPNHSIFLDANVLLGYYQMPWESRLKLYDFLEKNRDRVYISDQVKQEFERHRETVITEYQKKLVLEGSTARQKSVPAFIDDFLDLNEDVLEAYESLEEALEAVYENSYILLEKLEAIAKDRIQICKEQLQKQDIQTLMPLFQQLPALQKAEINLIQSEFEQLRVVVDNFDAGKAKNAVDAYLYKHPDKVFPGIGDIKKKPKSPYGDFIIFHEMMKWIGHFPQEVPVVFLTNDITKSDWLDGNKRAYTHYLENMKLNTGDIFYVLYADEIFSEVLEVNCAHLISSDLIVKDIEEAAAIDRKYSKKDLITVESVQELIQELYPDREGLDEEEDFWQGLVEDLEHDYELTSLFDLRLLLLENYHLLVQNELERFGVYDQLDALEVTLQLVFEE